MTFAKYLISSISKNGLRIFIKTVYINMILSLRQSKRKKTSLNVLTFIISYESKSHTREVLRTEAALQRYS